VEEEEGCLTCKEKLRGLSYSHRAEWP